MKKYISNLWRQAVFAALVTLVAGLIAWPCFAYAGWPDALHRGFALGLWIGLAIAAWRLVIVRPGAYRAVWAWAVEKVEKESTNNNLGDLRIAMGGVFIGMVTDVLFAGMAVFFITIPAPLFVVAPEDVWRVLWVSESSGIVIDMLVIYQVALAVIVSVASPILALAVTLVVAGGLQLLLMLTGAFLFIVLSIARFLRYLVRGIIPNVWRWSEPPRGAPPATQQS